jgi:hypothetical protein
MQTRAVVVVVVVVYPRGMPQGQPSAGRHALLCKQKQQ